MKSIMEKKVKVQAGKSGNVRIEIPKIIREMAGIEKGDEFVWRIDVATGELTCVSAKQSQE